MWRPHVSPHSWRHEERLVPRLKTTQIFLTKLQDIKYPLVVFNYNLYYEHSTEANCLWFDKMMSYKTSIDTDHVQTRAIVFNFLLFFLPRS